MKWVIFNHLLNLNSSFLKNHQDLHYLTSRLDFKQRYQTSGTDKTITARPKQVDNISLKGVEVDSIKKHDNLRQYYKRLNNTRLQLMWGYYQDFQGKYSGILLVVDICYLHIDFERVIDILDLFIKDEHYVSNYFLMHYWLFMKLNVSKHLLNQTYLFNNLLNLLVLHFTFSQFHLKPLCYFINCQRFEYLICYQYLSHSLHSYLIN